MSRIDTLNQRVKLLGKDRGEFKKHDSSNMPQYNVTTQLPGDTNVAGFGAGVDDLGQILLNQKKEVKFNRNLITKDGAEYWVWKKNQKIKPNKPKWSYAVKDINGDGVPEVVIIDGRGDIRYINGYHLAKSKHKYNYAYQQFVDSFGNPQERMIKRAKREIQPKQMSQQTFRWGNTKVNDANPDGPLLATGYLAKVGYEPKAPSACNLLLSYFTKFAYKSIVETKANKNEALIKAINKLYGVIRCNADIYKEFVTEEVNKYFKEQGVSEREAKKRYDGAPSAYSKKSLERVQEICQDTSGTIKPLIRQRIGEYIEFIYKKHLEGYTIPAKADYTKVKNPRVYPDGGKGVPDITKYLANYRRKGATVKVPTASNRTPKARMPDLGSSGAKKEEDEVLETSPEVSEDEE